MGIFDMFTAKPAAAPAPATAPQAQPPVAATPGNIPDRAAPATAASPATDPNGVVPNTPGANSPLAEFNNLWDTDPSKAAAPSTPTGLNQDDVQKAMSKADFSKFITPENLAAIAAGGTEAQQAFAASMNAIAQQVMVQSTLVNNKLTAQAVSEALAAQDARFPEMLRNHNSSDHLRNTNPLFSNPAVKPVIEATKAQLLSKYPNATAAEITQMTEKYIVQMGAAFAPAPISKGSDTANVDWEAYFRAE